MNFNEIKEAAKKKVNEARTWVNNNKDICDVIALGFFAGGCMVMGARLGAKAQYTKDAKMFNDYNAKIKTYMDTVNENYLDMSRDICMQGVVSNGNPAIMVSGFNAVNEIKSHTMETTTDIAMDLVDDIVKACNAYKNVG